METKIKVLLADDHPLLTAGLKMTIGEWEEFEVIGTACDGAEALRLAKELEPELIIMDMRMPKMSGAEAIGEIKKCLPQAKILALTTFDDEATVSGAMQAGCDGFLLKVIDQQKLKNSLLSVVGGINVYDEGVARRLREHARPQNELKYSPRELEILKLLCEGLTNVEIADRLRLRSGTVKNLVSLLLSKTNCISRVQLTRFASENHLIS